MSIHISSAVWNIIMPNSGRKLVALCIADQANHEGLAWPKIKTIAAQCNMCEESVRDHIEHLSAIGLFTVTPRFLNNKQLSNGYQFLSRGELEDPEVIIRLSKVGVSKPPRGGVSNFGRGGVSKIETPRTVIEPSMNRHKGASTESLGVFKFSDRNPRPYPTSEENMYQTLEAEGVEPDPDHDGDFHGDMTKKQWRHRGKPLADWVEFYRRRLEKTQPKPEHYR